MCVCAGVEVLRALVVLVLCLVRIYRTVWPVRDFIGEVSGGGGV